MYKYKKSLIFITSAKQVKTMFRLLLVLSCVPFLKCDELTTTASAWCYSLVPYLTHTHCSVCSASSLYQWASRPALGVIGGHWGASRVGVAPVGMHGGVNVHVFGACPRNISDILTQSGYWDLQRAFLRRQSRQSISLNPSCQDAPSSSRP
jgi:hypothetical protein